MAYVTAIYVLGPAFGWASKKQLKPPSSLSLVSILSCSPFPLVLPLVLPIWISIALPWLSSAVIPLIHLAKEVGILQ